MLSQKSAGTFFVNPPIAQHREFAVFVREVEKYPVAVLRIVQAQLTKNYLGAIHHVGVGAFGLDMYFNLAGGAVFGFLNRGDNALLLVVSEQEGSVRHGLFFL